MAVPNERDEPEQSTRPSLSSNELEARAEEFARQQDIQIGEHFQIEEAPDKDFVRLLNISPEAGQAPREYTHDLSTLAAPHSPLRVHINEVDRRFNLAVKNIDKQLTPHEVNAKLSKQVVSEWINDYRFVYALNGINSVVAATSTLSAYRDITKQLRETSLKPVYDRIKSDIVDFDVDEVMADFIMQQRNFWLGLDAGAIGPLDIKNFERVGKMIELLRAYKYDLPFDDIGEQTAFTRRNANGRLRIIKMPTKQLLKIESLDGAYVTDTLYQVGLKAWSMWKAVQPVVIPKAQPYEHNIAEMIAAGQDDHIIDDWFNPADHTDRYHQQIHSFLNKDFYAPLFQSILTLFRNLYTTKNKAQFAIGLATANRELIHNALGNVYQRFASDDEIVKQRETKSRLGERAHELATIVGLKSYGILDGESLRAFQGFEEDKLYSIQDHMFVQMFVYVVELFTGGGDEVRAVANMQRILTKAQLTFSKLDEETKELICGATYSQEAQIRGEGCRIIEGSTKKRKQPEPAKSEL